MLEQAARQNKTEVKLGTVDHSAISENTEARVSFPEPLIILAKHKFFILIFVGAVAVAALIIACVIPKTYTANARILPPQQNQSIAATAMLSQLGPLASLASQSLGLKSPSDTYVAMLRSETVANGLIDRFGLMSVYKSKLRVDARRHLENSSSIVAGKDGIITISVDDHDPQRAADLANGYVDELEKLTRTLAVTEAGKRRIFFEREVKIASDDLGNAELALKQTQEKTGLILLDSQSRAMIESLTSLRARYAAQEVLVQSMRSFATAENPDLIRAEKELAALGDQLARLEGGKGRRMFTDVPIENVPSAGLEYIRKLREVKYREALFELLAKQYEAAKIDEARDALIVQLMDKATPPERKSAPHRSVIVLIATILALLVAALAAFFMEAMERGKRDPEFVARFQLFRTYLRGQRRS